MNMQFFHSWPVPVPETSDRAPAAMLSSEVAVATEPKAEKREALAEGAWSFLWHQEKASWPLRPRSCSARGRPGATGLRRS